MASDKIEYSRLLIKRSNVSGEIPTVPPVSAVTLNQFTPTDIFVGEFFANVEDETLYFRTNTGIVEIAVSGSTGTTIPSLVQVLNQGNTTGGFGIEVSSGNTITFNGLTSGATATYLGLDASGNTITTVGGAGGQDLETTLGFGNTTGANDIIFTQGYRVKGALNKGYFEPEGADESISINYTTTGNTGYLNIGDSTAYFSYTDAAASQSFVAIDGNKIQMTSNGGSFTTQQYGASSGLTINPEPGFPLYVTNLTTGTSINSLALDTNNRVILAPTIGSTVIGTTIITSGTTGRVLFEGAGNVFQQDSQLFWDNTNKGLGVGATPSSTVKLDVRADSALSTDLAFRVRDNTDSFNIIEARNNGDVYVGAYAGYQSTGAANTFVGQIAGYVNTTGVSNSFFGWSAGRDNTGNANSFFGREAGTANTTGTQNSFFGQGSGQNNLTGNQNTHIGNQAGLSIASGSLNVSMGYLAGNYIGTGTTSGNTSSSNSVFIGAVTNALATGQTNQIVIGYQARGLGSNSSIIGNSSTTLFKLFGSGLFENVAVAPSASVTDSFHLYGADIVAGNSAPHFRTEAGDTIKLYKEAEVTTPQGIATALSNLGLLTTSTLTGRTQQNITSDTNQTIDGSVYNAITWIQSNSATARTLNVTNLPIGSSFTAYIRNNNVSNKTYTFQAAGASFDITNGIGGLITTATLTQDSGVTIVYENINGTIVGRV